MKKIETDSYMQRQAGIGSAAARLFDTVTTHPAFGHMFRGTNLDPASGLLGVVTNYLESTGITDKDARSLATIADKMAGQFSSLEAKRLCDGLSDVVKELMNDINADHALLSMTASNPKERVRLLQLFDYRFSTFSRAYVTYINKYGNEVGIVDKKAQDFGSKCIDTVARSAFNLFHRLENKFGPFTQGSDICP